MFFFFNDTATTEIYTLSLHDALPIWRCRGCGGNRGGGGLEVVLVGGRLAPDRKSTRLNSSHSQISYAVFCLKKKRSTLPRSLDVDARRVAAPRALAPRHNIRTRRRAS